MKSENSMWEMYVPTIRSNGNPIKTRFHRVWDAKVREIAGGLTVLKPAIGQWVSPDGKLFNEKMIPVRIMCSDDDISKIIDMSMKYYEQKAVLAYCISSKCILRYADE